MGGHQQPTAHRTLLRAKEQPGLKERAMDMDLNAAMTEFDVGFGPMMPDADIIHTGRVPIDTYVLAERFEKEMEVFRRVWLNVALDSEVPNVGDRLEENKFELPSLMSTSDYVFYLKKKKKI